MIISKRIDTSLLAQELRAAGLDIPLGTAAAAVQGQTQVFTYRDGVPDELPPEARALVDAHVAPPDLVTLTRDLSIDAVVRTTGAQPKEIYRVSCAPKHLYVATLALVAADAASGAAKHAEAKIVFKRLAGAPVQVGATTLLFPPIEDAAAVTWAVLPSADGNDAVLSVRGTSGRTIDWLLSGLIQVYAPEGLEAS